MANIKIMSEFFDNIRSIIHEISEDDEIKKDLLNNFFIRVLTVIDGLEGQNIEWNGIALVARDDLPDNVQEINDEFLHESWSID